MRVCDSTKVVLANAASSKRGRLAIGRAGPGEGASWRCPVRNHQKVSPFNFRAKKRLSRQSGFSLASSSSSSTSSIRMCVCVTHAQTDRHSAKRPFVGVSMCVRLSCVPLCRLYTALACVCVCLCVCLNKLLLMRLCTVCALSETHRRTDGTMYCTVKCGGHATDGRTDRLGQRTVRG